MSERGSLIQPALFNALRSGKCKGANAPRLNIARAGERGYVFWWSAEAPGFNLVGSGTVLGP